LKQLKAAIKQIKKISKSSILNERDDSDIPSRSIKYVTTAKENLNITVNYGTQASAAKAKLATRVEITGSKGEIGRAKATSLKW